MTQHTVFSKEYSLVKQDIDDLLHDYCEQKVSLASQYGESYERLWREIDTYLQAGGKRIRPFLIYLTYCAYGGKDRDSILSIGTAWEMLHSCLLIHDDIIDRDTVRHGVDNIAGRYEKIYRGSSDASHFAAGAAILAGDLLMSGAYETILSAELDNEKLQQTYALLSRAVFGVAGGELMDMEIVLSDVASADAIKIARFKTAEYSCEYPMICGANIAGASNKEKEKIKRLALAMGIGFQLADDVLGVFGEESTTGKTANGDIREKKRTMLLQETYQRLKGPDKKQLVAIMDSTAEPRPSEIERVRVLMESSGAKDAVMQKIAELKKQALGVVEEMAISDEFKSEYAWIIGKLLDRDS